MSDIRLPRPAARSEFRKRLRAELMNEAVMLAEERRMRRPTGLALLVMRLRPLAVAAAIVVFAVAGSGVAAAGSLPGDLAYGLKRAAEEVELALAADDGTRVRVLTTQAERRLDELGKSASRSDKAPTASAEYQAAVQRLATAVAALRTAEPGEKREAAEQVVEAAKDKHVQVLETLRERLPQNAQEKIDRAIEQHKKIEEERPAPKPSDRPRNTPPGKASPRKP